MKTIFEKNLAIHPSWKPFFDREDVQAELKYIEEKIENAKKPYTPQPYQVLRFATTDLQQVKVVILGLDPYPTLRANGELVATGRAFEVNGITSWEDKEINPSLKNIVKLIHKSYMKNENEISDGYQEVLEDIRCGRFTIPNPNVAFSYWEQQGVLWLNTAFTCEIGCRAQSKSHVKYWNQFFLYLLEFIATQQPDILYFLWGGHASKYSKNLIQFGVPIENLYESKHPCTNGDNGGYQRKSAFLMNPCFKESKSRIRWILES